MSISTTSTIIVPVYSKESQPVSVNQIVTPTKLKPADININPPGYPGVGYTGETGGMTRGGNPPGK